MANLHPKSNGAKSNGVAFDSQANINRNLNPRHNDTDSAVNNKGASERHTRAPAPADPHQDEHPPHNRTVHNGYSSKGEYGTEEYSRDDEGDSEIPNDHHFVSQPDDHDPAESGYRESRYGRSDTDSYRDRGGKMNRKGEDDEVPDKANREDDTRED